MKEGSENYVISFMHEFGMEQRGQFDFTWRSVILLHTNTFAVVKLISIISWVITGVGNGEGEALLSAQTK